MGVPPSIRRYANRHNARLGAVVALGGAAGAALRGWIEQESPPAPGTFPVTTLVVNVAGCFCIGMLMVLLEESLRGRTYARPFLGIGFLGGFTTFSLVAEETRALLADHPFTALVYVTGTPVAAVASTALGFAATTWALAPRPRLTEH